jgi:hypothetical protein
MLLFKHPVYCTWCFSSVQYVEYYGCCSPNKVATGEALVRLDHVHHVVRDSSHVAGGGFVGPNIQMLIHLVENGTGKGRIAQIRTFVGA